MEDIMDKRRWEQIGAAGGIVFVLLQLAGQALIQVGGAEPSFNAPAGEIVAFFENRNPQLFAAGGFLSVIAVFALFWFLGVLWARLRRHEEEPAWMSLVAFGSGLVSVAAVFANSGWALAVFRINEGLDPQLARTLFDSGNFGFATFWVFLAIFLFTTGIVILRDGALPGWLGWFGLVTAIALLIARAFWAVSGAAFIPYVLFWLWLIITSIILIRRARRNEATRDEKQIHRS
jgi:hypothetical protein